MRVQIKELRYWKTELGPDGCQDAYDLDPTRGLFVVADGAGTTLFPAIWARILSKHFVKIPLMGNDPFEVEWWVRLAQEEYKTSIPDMGHLLDWSIRQKAQNQSSDSTLATVRITAIDASSAQAELLVFGDSCIIIGDKHTKKVESFVLNNAADFAAAPVCIPSSLKFFNRDFHTCSTKSVTLRPENIVILASDAVAKWIISGGGGHFADDEQHSPGVWKALQTVSSVSKETWPGFIEGCRVNKEMVNDDSTALILDMKEDTAEEGIALGTTAKQSDVVIQERKAAFEKARQEQNNELVAIYYGDGKVIQPLVPGVTNEEIHYAKEVANALKEVLRAFRQAQNLPGLAARMQPIWDRYGPILQKEKCAENIRETLQRNGINLIRTAPEPLNVATAASPGSEAHNTQSSTGRPHAQQNQQDVAVQQAEQEKTKLENSFLRAYSASYETNNDEVLLAATTALRTVDPDYHFLDAQNQQISLAEDRVQAMEKLRKALRDSFIEEIETASHSNLISLERLTADESKRIQLARRLMEALRSDDDERILAESEELSLSDNNKFFNLTEQIRQRINLARRRKEAMKTFRVFLRTGRLQEIVENYNPILDSSNELTENDRELLQLAREFVEACDVEDDVAIVATHKKFKQSSNYEHIAFMPRENQRIERAERHLQVIQHFRETAIAKVKGQYISLEQVRQVGAARKAYNGYWIDQYQEEIKNTPDEAIRQGKIQYVRGLQDYIDWHKLAGNVLEELIRDEIICDEMKDAKVQNAFLNEYDVMNRLNADIDAFQNHMVSDYRLFLRRNWMSDSDIEDIFKIFLRYDFFKSYFESQQQKIVPPKLPIGFKKPKQLDDWLRQRKDVIYMYSSNFEQRALWMAEQFGWKA